MHIKPIIYTSTRNPDKAWFRDTFNEIYETVRLTKGLTIDPFHVEYKKPDEKPPLRIDEHGQKCIDWKWFAEKYTQEGATKGYNCIIMHAGRWWRKRVGLEVRIAGTYRNDTDGFIEIYVCADTKKQFARIVKHEIGHFVERTLFNNTNQKTVARGVEYDCRVHAYDYALHDLNALFASFSFEKYNTLMQTLTEQLAYLEAKLAALLLLKKTTLAGVCETAIGTDASPSDLAPDELGCAETVTTLLKKVYPETPILTGTYSLYDYLRNPKNGYARQVVPTLETIIVCATGTGNGKMPGHTGIFLWKEGKLVIASNDSYTGKFEKNFTVDEWIARYVTKGGFTIHLFKKV